MRTIPVARDGRVHVEQSRCATCIFRPGNLMHLEPGRVAEMTRLADTAESCIPCHSTMDTDAPTVCRGYFDRRSSTSLQIAERLGLIEFVSSPVKP